MDDIYLLSDVMVLRRIGEHLRSVRLRQNITQQHLAVEAGLSVSSLKKIEKGEIASMDSFLRVLRTLGKLDVLYPLVEEEPVSPNEYYEIVNRISHKQRRRASGKRQDNSAEESEW